MGIASGLMKKAVYACTCQFVVASDPFYLLSIPLFPSSSIPPSFPTSPLFFFLPVFFFHLRFVPDLHVHVPFFLFFFDFSSFSLLLPFLSSISANAFLISSIFSCLCFGFIFSSCRMAPIFQTTLVCAPYSLTQREHWLFCRD